MSEAVQQPLIPTCPLWLSNLLVCLGSSVLAVVGILSAAPGRNESPIWPAAGVALAAIWLWGGRLWPGVFAGAALGSWLAPGVRTAIAGEGFHVSALGLSGALVVAVGNVLAAGIAGRLLRAGDQPLRLDRVGNAVRLWGACAIYAAISGVCGASVIVALTPTPLTAWPAVALTWGSGDLVGALVVAPVIGLAALGTVALPRRREAVAVALALAASLVVGLALPGEGARGSLAFLVFLPLLWAALRLPALWAALATAAAAVGVYAASVGGAGPFAGFGSDLAQLLGLQAFIISATLAMHLLAVVTLERAAAMAALGSSEERFRLLSENSRDLVCLHDLDGRFTYVSPSAQLLLGRRPEQLTGTTPWPLIHPDDLPAVRIAARPRRLSDSSRRSLLFRIQRADGGWIWLETTASLVHAAKGEPAAVQTASRDVSARILRENELAQARVAAESAVRAKAAFLAAMSHEIRTPLNGVIGMAEALAGDSPDVRSREAAGIIRRSGETLLAILNDILDFSKIEAGRIDLEWLPVDPRALAGDVHALFARLAAEKGLALTLDIAADAPAVIISDPARLRQILSNLLSNAVKFTRRGTVSLRVARLPPGQGSRFGGLELAVSDTGIGIPSEARGRLFNEFTQGEPGTARRYGGTGLGLAISRRLVEALGGTIDLVSEPGGGSIFTVHLPLPDPATAPPGPNPSDAALPVRPRAGLRVLVAEDDAVNQTVAAALLRHFAAESTIVPDGAAALLTWEGGSFDIVLLDVQMPGMDGLDTTRAIRSHEAAHGLARVPILAMTANAFPEDRKACNAAGMDGLIAKPITLAALGAALAQHTREGRAPARS